MPKVGGLDSATAPLSKISLLTSPSLPVGHQAAKTSIDRIYTTAPSGPELARLEAADLPSDEPDEPDELDVDFVWLHPMKSLRRMAPV